MGLKNINDKNILNCSIFYSLVKYFKGMNTDYCSFLAGIRYNL